MTKLNVLLLLLVCGLVSISATEMAARQDSQGGTGVRVVVDLVQLNVAVTDNKGKYVTGLKPSDFEIIEDNVPQKIATFGEGNESPRILADIPPDTSKGDRSSPGRPQESLPPQSGSAEALITQVNALAGASVYILFDTSNYMYRGFVFAQDAIADFVRSLEGPDRVAFYSYSRDLYRAASLTPNKSQVLQGVRATTAGDDAALYDALLLTLKDAGPVKGRKVVVVFSNGPDNASMVPPEDLDELAQSEGIPIYMISTREAKIEPVSTAVFGRMSAATGGEAFFAKDWQEEQQAFAAIRDDLGHLYSVNYYPQPNPNSGWRSIKVKLVGSHLKQYHVRTRNGYRPLPARFFAQTAP
jgi:Ca-activated chloride channel family protein